PLRKYGWVMPDLQQTFESSSDGGAPGARLQFRASCRGYLKSPDLASCGHTITCVPAFLNWSSALPLMPWNCTWRTCERANSPLGANFRSPTRVRNVALCR